MLPAGVMRRVKTQGQFSVHLVQLPDGEYKLDIYLFNAGFGLGSLLINGRLPASLKKHQWV